MATHISAEKRARQALKRRSRNQTLTSAMKTYEKRVRQAVEKKDAKLAGDALKTFIAAYDKAASKGVVHANKASRKVSRLSQLVGQLK